MAMFRTSFSKISIKWQLLVICVFLVSVPTAVLGIMIYDALRTEAVTSVESHLALAVNDWRLISSNELRQDDRGIAQDWLLGQMSSQRPLDVGYFWVIDDQGRYVLSPGRQRDGHSVIDEVDAFGQPIIQEMLNAAKGSRPGEVLIRYYDWGG